jgi:Flp pilus assembly protein TadG
MNRKAILEVLRESTMSVRIRRWGAHCGRRPRSGSYVAELLFAMPVIIVFLWAVIEFGMFFANMQVLALASRSGARAASEASLPIPDPLPSEPEHAVVTAVDQQLASSHIGSYQIRVEWNEGDNVHVSYYPSGATWDCAPDEVLPAPPLPASSYVRVSVCVPMSELMPNLLAVFGFDASARVASHTTVMLHVQD